MTEMCFDEKCRVQKIYAADLIIEDNWNYNLKFDAVGILGLGPNSAMWN